MIINGIVATLHIEHIDDNHDNDDDNDDDNKDDNEDDKDDEIVDDNADDNDDDNNDDNDDNDEDDENDDDHDDDIDDTDVDDNQNNTHALDKIRGIILQKPTIPSLPTRLVLLFPLPFPPPALGVLLYTPKRDLGNHSSFFGLFVVSLWSPRVFEGFRTKSP